MQASMMQSQDNVARKLLPPDFDTVRDLLPLIGAENSSLEWAPQCSFRDFEGGKRLRPMDASSDGKFGIASVAAPSVLREDGSSSKEVLAHDNFEYITARGTPTLVRGVFSFEEDDSSIQHGGGDDLTGDSGVRRSEDDSPLSAVFRVRRQSFHPNSLRNLREQFERAGDQNEHFISVEPLQDPAKLIGTPRDNERCVDLEGWTADQFLDYYLLPNEEKQPPLLFGKDMPIPPRWSKALFEMMPLPVRHMGERDIYSSMPVELRPVSVMSYLGHHNTFTPGHKDLAGSLGQNLMIWSDTAEEADCPPFDGDPPKIYGSHAIWFCVNHANESEAHDYWQKSGITDADSSSASIEHDNQFLSLEKLKKAPFKVYVVIQQPGDLVLIPPSAPHQVINKGGGLTAKLAWNSISTQSLCHSFQELDLLWKYRKPEIYRIRSLAFHALTEFLKKKLEEGTAAHRIWLADVERLTRLVTQQQSSERIQFSKKDCPQCFFGDEEHELQVLGAAKRLEPRLADSPHVVRCDSCNADAFNQFYACSGCNADLCIRCVAEGRLTAECTTHQFSLQCSVDPHEIDDLLERARSVLGKGLKEAESSKLTSRGTIAHRLISVINSGQFENHGARCHQCKNNYSGDKLKSPNRWLACCTVCTSRYCSQCLFRRYGDSVFLALQNPKWECPKCREICNCAACRGGAEADLCFLSNFQANDDQAYGNYTGKFQTLFDTGVRIPPRQGPQKRSDSQQGAKKKGGACRKHKLSKTRCPEDCPNRLHQVDEDLIRAAEQNAVNLGGKKSRGRAKTATPSSLSSSQGGLGDTQHSVSRLTDRYKSRRRPDDHAAPDTGALSRSEIRRQRRLEDEKFFGMMENSPEADIIGQETISIADGDVVMGGPSIDGALKADEFERSTCSVCTGDLLDASTVECTTCARPVHNDCVHPDCSREQWECAHCSPFPVVVVIKNIGHLALFDYLSCLAPEDQVKSELEEGAARGKFVVRYFQDDRYGFGTAKQIRIPSPSESFMSPVGTEEEDENQQKNQFKDWLRRNQVKVDSQAKVSGVKKNMVETVDLSFLSLSRALKSFERGSTSLATAVDHAQRFDAAERKTQARVFWAVENDTFSGYVRRYDYVGQEFEIVYEDGDVVWHSVADVKIEVTSPPPTPTARLSPMETASRKRDAPESPESGSDVGTIPGDLQGGLSQEIEDIRKAISSSHVGGASVERLWELPGDAVIRRVDNALVALGFSAKIAWNSVSNEFEAPDPDSSSHFFKFEFRNMGHGHGAFVVQHSSILDTKKVSDKLGNLFSDYVKEHFEDIARAFPRDLDAVMAGVFQEPQLQTALSRINELQSQRVFQEPQLQTALSRINELQSQQERPIKRNKT